MLSAEHYLHVIEQAFLSTGGVVVRSEITLPPVHYDSIEVLRLRLEYLTGHVLDVTVTVDVSVGYPIWAIYSVQLMDPEVRCVVRYDNAPHHPEFDTFPHHQHVGPDERPAAHPRPVLAHLVREIQTTLRDSLDQ